MRKIKFWIKSEKKFPTIDAKNRCFVDYHRRAQYFHWNYSPSRLSLVVWSQTTVLNGRLKAEVLPIGRRTALIGWKHRKINEESAVVVFYDYRQIHWFWPKSVIKGTTVETWAPNDPSVGLDTNFFGSDQSPAQTDCSDLVHIPWLLYPTTPRTETHLIQVLCVANEKSDKGSVETTSAVPSE